MADNKMKSGQKYWRSLEQLADTPEFREKLKQEFPLGASELEIKAGVDRRNFLGIIGASLALAGVTSTGCIRKPKEKILPYSRRPEDLVEGVAQQYATALSVGTGVLGVLVTSHENRPTKVEGNPAHPLSLGATNAWAQASILDLYDPDRSQFPASKGNKIDWEQAISGLKDFGVGLKNSRGNGFALLIDGTPSPSLRALISEMQAVAPGLRLFVQDSSVRLNQQKGFAFLGLAGHESLLDLDKAQVIVSLDADFLGTEGDVVRQTKLFAAGRKLTDGKQSMNRLYAIEPAFSTTGVMADHRLQLRSSEVGDLLLALVKELSKRGVQVADALLAKANAFVANEAHSRWVSALAADLVANSGKSLIVVGDRQPAWVHAAAIAVNDALRATGQTIRYALNPVAYSDAGSLPDLVAAISGGAVSHVLALGTNPAYTAPGDLGMFNALGNLKQFVHLSYYQDETSQLASLHVPASHAFESWLDLRGRDGTVTICQPVIEPIYQSLSVLETLAIVLDREQKSPYEIVKAFWSAGNTLGVTLGASGWNRALHDGVVEGTQLRGTFAQGFNLAGLGGALDSVVQQTQKAAGDFELVFPYSPAVFDGRYANNAWLQELPDTVTKLTWDNAALISPKTAQTLGVKNTQIVQISTEAGSLDVPVWITPGVAENVISLPLGWGRRFEGRVCAGTGFDGNSIRSFKSPHFALGAKVTVTKKTYALASTQDHGSMEGRAIVRETTLEQFKAEPQFVQKFEMMPAAKQKTLLWDRPWDYKTGQQWGMSIDLNACTGCNACSVACTAENNVSVVGKERVLNGREMHWIRIDRYFTGSVDDPQAVVQPVGCQHCESAPCEQVCPVGATAHSPDGMNDMAYNRCIGTRYCANNCPFKVRRFNYFAYAKENDESNPLYAMQKNPNVTVRFRGVIEKCSYCVHRVNAAKIHAKKFTNGIVPDGGIVTACQQACPADAIQFGDVNDANSVVSKAKAEPRNYVMLGELAIQPRTSFLAKIRNPNPELV